MRPVNHPPQPAATTYPEFRMDTEEDLYDDLDGYTWDTTASAPKDYFNAPLTAWDALARCLLKLIVDPPPPPPKPKQHQKKKQKTAVTLQEVKHYAELFRDKTYRKANTPLLNGLGRYCSFCEQRLTEMVAVEHVVAKAPYPVTALCWENFLLCCRACNSNKANKPARDVAWLAGVIDDPEVKVAKAIRAHYLLPDDSLNAYFSLPPVLRYRQGGTWANVPNSASVSNSLARASTGNATTKQPRANVPFSAGAAVVDVAVVTPPTAPDLAYAQATEEMLGFQKNGVGSTDDNRMWDRTNVWLTAVQSFAMLNGQKGSAFDALWRMLCQTAAHTGFLTVWVRVLELRGGAAAPYPPPPAKKTSNLLAQFLDVMVNQHLGEPEPPYPNTDLANLP